MPAPKKRELDQVGSESYSDAFLSDVKAEVDLEIALRQRLVETLESRVAWALTLKEALNDGNGNGNVVAPDHDAFRNVALDTLRVVDSQSDFLLSHDPLPPLLTIPTRIPRPPPRKVVPSSTGKPKPSFIYIRSAALPNAEKTGGGDDRFHLLQCPACSRTSFTALQGLLNHARLVHNLEWGSHDECVRACAVQSKDLDISRGIEVGLGPMGILPGLRTLFQVAVGVNGASESTAVEENTSSEGVLPSPTTHAGGLTTSHLYQTLGLHEETPALAPFLGKEPLRRQIKVADEDAEVDIGSVTTCSSHTKTGPGLWRMPFAQRNFDQPPNGAEPQGHQTLPKDTATQDATCNNVLLKESSGPPPTSIIPHSRFHLVARIIITDRSMWILPDQRPSKYQRYSHKWMISVDSPSYALHITSVLTNVKVTASDPNISIPLPQEANCPPFVVIGLSDRPFLARIVLTFVGTPSSAAQTFVFEHWVDLYPIQTEHAAKGDDQVVDIDLDKDTILNVAQHGYTPIEHKSLWKRPFTADVEDALESEFKEPVQAYEQSLKTLTKHFPMTLQDFKGKRSKLPQLPYLLASSKQHLLSFVMGRRKAIEWARSRAIQTAYSELIAQSPEAPLMPLTVAAVYSWLSDNGHFPRPEQSHTEGKSGSPSASKGAATWCRFCGLDQTMHEKAVTAKKEGPENQLSLAELDDKTSVVDTSIRPPAVGCQIVAPELQITKFPRLNIRRLSTSEQQPMERVLRFEDRSLVAAADPSMTKRIFELAQEWDLRTCHGKKADSETGLALMPSEEFGEDRKAVETILAPHALLALITERFIHALVSRGLDVANRDKAMALSLIPPRRRNRSQQTTIRLLTPTHILSGVLTRGLGKEINGRPIDFALLFSLSKLGVPFDEDTPAASRQGETSAKVKVEVEDTLPH